MRSALVVVEVALAVILLVGAALFIGSFRELMKIDPGLDAENVLEAYLPLAQQPTFFAELLVKTTGNPSIVLPAVKAAAAEAMPGVLLRNIRTMDDVLSRLTAQRRLNMLLLGLFGLLGLVISAVGVYGVMAYVVSQRTREIGVRMALGATRTRVLSMIVRNATILVASGLLIGGIAAWMLRGAADGFLFRVQVNDPRAFAAALGTLAVAALVASVIPAVRAASVDPTVALRDQ